MIRRARKSIGINNFMKFWEKAQRGEARQIIPTLFDDIKRLWQDELRLMFTELKKNMSYGQISNQELHQWASQLIVPDKELPYGGVKGRSTTKENREAWKAARRYIKQYPNIYVKTGELKRKILSDAQFKEKVSRRKVGIRLSIPLKSENMKYGTSPRTYQYLESKRSYLKSSFLRAWPKILDKIMERLIE